MPGIYPTSGAAAGAESAGKASDVKSDAAVIFPGETVE
jgi:hypothetical protein